MINHARGHSSAEHLRQHVKTGDGDSVYDRCYGWREDSESLDNTVAAAYPDPGRTRTESTVTGIACAIWVTKRMR